MVQERNSILLKLLLQWQEEDYKHFAEAMGDGKIILAIVKSYEEIGLSGELFLEVFQSFKK